jgi:nucleotide-binding universal stress UspA family protein
VHEESGEPCVERRTEMLEYPKKVLLARDGTEDSARAASVAVALAGRDGAELHVVHVGQAATSAYGVAAEGGALPGEPSGYAEREARKLLERQVKEIRAAGGPVTGSVWGWARRLERPWA